MILAIIPILLVVAVIALAVINNDSKRMDEAVARHVAELSKILENGGNR